MFKHLLKGIALIFVLFSLTACGGGGGGDEAGGGTDTGQNGSGGGSNGGGSNDEGSNDDDSGDGGSDDGGSDDGVISAFPASLAVVSPTSVSTSVQQASLIGSGNFPFAANAVASGIVHDYEFNVAILEGLLTGTTEISDEVDLELLFEETTDADCYGPFLAYENHPDTPVDSGDPDAGNGEFPTGDLGLWTETEDGGSEACAAAQLNERMEGVNNNSSVALMVLASMITAYEDNGANSWPEDVSAGDSIDLLSEMNAAGITSTNFTSATMSLNAGGDQWTYHLEFEFTLDLVAHEVVLNLEHAPGSSDDAYEGLLTFRINNSFSGGNCGAGDNDVSINGSLHYIQASATDLVLQYRQTQFCGHDVDGIQTAITSSNLTGNMVSASPTGSLVDNWSDNFTIFTADFNPSTLGGTFYYAWQAGYNDSHSRILNVGLDAATAGEAYFGFGHQVHDSLFDGGARGFICNWAGPGNDHTLQEYVQRQHITLDTDAGIFTPTNHGQENDSSDIIYAPANSCRYDSTDDIVEGNVFVYDRDVNSVIDSSDISDVLDTVTDSDSQLEFGLRDIPDSSSETTIWDYITNDRGYDLPDYP